MKILIVDDNQIKTDMLARFLRECSPGAELVCASNAQDGFRQLQLSETPFNLVLLDIVIPKNLGDLASESGSLWFVREIEKKISSAPFVIGTTQYLDSMSLVESTFQDHLWTVAYISDKDDSWRRRLSNAVRFAQSITQRRSLSLAGDAQSIDVAIVAALRIPEFDELMDVLGGGEQVLLEETHESWLRCQVDLPGGRQVDVIAACADEMGMTAMAALVTRLCIAYKPKKLLLVGIMGGNANRVGLADLIVVEETWNSQAGKTTETSFEPDMKVERCDYKLVNSVRSLVDKADLVTAHQEWKGDKPDRIPTLHFGAVACSPSVIADNGAFAELERHKRKIHGVEMEAFGCYVAAQRLGDLAPKVICIKSVCDLGDHAKNDKYQRFCAHLSALVAVNLIKNPKFVDA